MSLVTTSKLFYKLKYVHFSYLRHIWTFCTGHFCYLRGKPRHILPIGHIAMVGLATKRRQSWSPLTVKTVLPGQGRFFLRNTRNTLNFINYVSKHLKDCLGPRVSNSFGWHPHGRLSVTKVWSALLLDQVPSELSGKARSEAWDFYNSRTGHRPISGPPAEARPGPSITNTFCH